MAAAAPDRLAEGAQAQEQSNRSRVAYEAAAAYLSVLQSRLTIEYSNEYESLLQRLLSYIRSRAEAGAVSRAELDRVSARAQNARASRAEGEASLAVNLHQLRRLTGVAPDAIRVPDQFVLPVPADVETALQQALDQSADIKALKKNIESAEYAAKSQRGRFVPNLGIELGSSAVENSSGVVGRQYDRRAMLVLNYNLFASGADRAAYDAGVARRKEQEYRLQDVTGRLQEEIANQYALLSAASQRLLAVRGELSANERVVQAFTSQFTEARRPLLDVLDSYQRYYQSKVDVTSLLVADVLARLRILHSTGNLAKIATGAAS